MDNAAAKKYCFHVSDHSLDDRVSVTSVTNAAIAGYDPKKTKEKQVKLGTIPLLLPVLRYTYRWQRSMNPSGPSGRARPPCCE
jgi:hypothetical protein